MTEGQKRKINRESGPKKDIITVKEREREVLDSVLAVHRKSLEKLIREYGDVFLKNYPRVRHPIERCNIALKSNRVVNPLISLLTYWVLLTRMS